MTEEREIAKQLSSYDIGRKLFFAKNRNLVKSIEHFKLSLPALIKTNKKDKQGIALRMISINYSMLKNYKEALSFALKAIKVFEELNDISYLMKTHYSISITYYKLGDFKEAYFHVQKAGEYLKTKKAGRDTDRYRMLCGIGEGIVLAGLKKYNAGIEKLHAALKECDDKDRQLIIKEYLAEIYFLTGKHEDAFAIYNEIIKHSKVKRAIPYLKRARLHWHDEKILRDYNTAIEIAESERDEIDGEEFKSVFLEQRKKEVYDTAIKYFVENNHPEDAFRAIQKIKARTLADRLCVTDEEKNELFGVANLKSITVGINEVSSFLSDGSVCLDIYTYDNKIVLFVISKNFSKMEVVEYDEKKLKNIISNIISFIRIGNIVHLNDCCAEFYSGIFEKALNECGEIKKLIVIPYQIFHEISFALFEKKYDICYLPAVSLFGSFAKHSYERPRSCLVLADADSNLKGAREEAAVVGSVMKKSRVFYGNDATPDNLLNNFKDHGVLHIACHTEFMSEDPMSSCVYLKDNDGKRLCFTVRDVMKMDLRNLKLVVLSSCESGKGRILGMSDEIVCLPRAFLRAGAKGVIVTFGVVDDEKTVELMKEFYENLAGGKTIPTSLRLAQESVRLKYPQSFFWSGFQYIGV